MADRALRIAMWSGPRNISTAMMRSFENRPDCVVSDEPLYGAWLKMSGAPHPMRKRVIEAMETDWRKVVDRLAGPIPDNHPLWYQKHMTHHLLPEMMETDWLSQIKHVFLIRAPEQVVASYLKKRDTVSPEDIGLPQQQQIYDFIHGRLGQNPPVIDSSEFLADPEGHLRALCDWLDIDFLPEMLAWPKGPRDSDGVWASHWYQSVWESTGFGPPPNTTPRLQGKAREVADACRPLYEQLHARRLKP